MKVAVIIFAALVAGSSASLFSDSINAYILEGGNALTLKNAVNAQISAALSNVTSSVTSQTSILTAVGQSVLAFVSGYGSCAQTLINIVNASITNITAVVNQQFNATLIGQQIMAPYYVINTNITAQVTSDVNSVSAKIMSKTLNYTCLQNEQPTIVSQTNTFVALIGQKKTEQYETFQAQAAELNAEINAAITAYELNITTTCGSDCGCVVSQGLLLEPQIEGIINGLISEAQADVNEQIADGATNAAALQTYFYLNYNAIKTNITACSA